ncbi:MAG: Holliday junction branch migration protein RuvA [Verrucomicrobia bacterium]|nr:Holliday junction branch migration protein RuvA [Verrucomicrobiota bacterium]
MYEYIKGTLTESNPSKATIEAGGIGYSLLIPLNNFSKLPPLGTQVVLYASFVVREDSQKMFGFLTREQRDLFESLIEVSGIGPKTGLCLVGHMEIPELQSAISQGNTQLICKIPGIGKKTAERLIVEMRDKIKKGMGKSSGLHPLQDPDGEQGVVADAISALVNLGYNSAQAQKAIKAALTKTQGEPELAKLITSALRNI